MRTLKTKLRKLLVVAPLACGLVCAQSSVVAATQPAAPVAEGQELTGMEKVEAMDAAPLRLKGDPQLDAQGQPTGDPQSTGLLSMIAMTLLAGAAFGVLVLMRKRKDGSEGARDPNQLHVLSALRLGGKWQLSLVQVPGRLLVIGATEKGLTTLAEIPQNEGMAAPASAPAPVHTPASSPIAQRAPSPPLSEAKAEPTDDIVAQLLSSSALRKAAERASGVPSAEERVSVAAVGDVRQREEFSRRLGQYGRARSIA